MKYPHCKKNLVRTFLSLLFFFTAAICFAQIHSATAKVDKNKVLLGEQFFLTIEVTAAMSELLVLPKIDTIPHFEILEKMDPERSGNMMTQVYRLTSFDSGHWVIPSFRLSGKDATDTIHMDVVFSDFDPKQDYHDIKDIIAIKPEGPVNWFWWIVIASLVILLVIVWLIVRRKKPVVTNIDSVDAYDEAMDRLDNLKKSNLPAREYYSQIVDVFRLYVFKRKGILSLQKTTDDLVYQLTESGMNKTIFSELSQALRLADFVKFAKYQPAEEDRIKTAETIRQAITMIEKTTGEDRRVE